MNGRMRKIDKTNFHFGDLSQLIVAHVVLTAQEHPWICPWIFC